MMLNFSGWKCEGAKHWVQMWCSQQMLGCHRPKYATFVKDMVVVKIIKLRWIQFWKSAILLQEFFTSNNTGLRIVYTVVSNVDNELDSDQLYKRWTGNFDGNLDLALIWVLYWRPSWSAAPCTHRRPTELWSVQKDPDLLIEKRLFKKPEKIKRLPQHLKTSILPPSVPQRRRLRRSATHVTSSKGLALFWVFQTYMMWPK